MKNLRTILTAMIVALLPSFALAEGGSGYKTYSKKATFAEVRDDLKDAIVNSGYVVDFVGHFNAMLKRTSEAAGSVTAAGVKSPYRNAQYMQFCAAKLTHQAISADPRNIANCPYIVFVYELGYDPGNIHVGYRQPAPGATRTSKRVNKKIEAMLDGIVRDAIK